MSEVQRRNDSRTPQHPPELTGPNARAAALISLIMVLFGFLLLVASIVVHHLE